MFNTVLRRLITTGFRRGMGGSRAWLVVGVAATGIRVLRRIARDDEEVVYRTAVKPGDVFEIVSKLRTK